MNRIDAHSEVTLKREETENREEKLCERKASSFTICIKKSLTFIIYHATPFEILFNLNLLPIIIASARNRLRENHRFNHEYNCVDDKFVGFFFATKVCEAAWAVYGK